jgi:hypothetical protein
MMSSNSGAYRMSAVTGRTNNSNINMGVINNKVMENVNGSVSATASPILFNPLNDHKYEQEYSKTRLNTREQIPGYIGISY